MRNSPAGSIITQAGRCRDITLLAAAMSTAMFQQSVRAADQTWKSAGFTNGDWALADNWIGGAVPGAASGTANGNTATFQGGINTLVSIDATRNIQNLVFDNASGFTFVGGGLFLTNAGAITINSNTANSQNINTPITLSPTASATYSFINNSVSSGVSLNIGGNVSGATDASVETLTLGGAGTGLVSGVISNGVAGGTLALAKAGAGTWTFTGANTYTGTTTISGGTLKLDGNTGALSSSSPLSFHGGDSSAGGGKFIYQSSVAGSTQSLGALSFTSGSSGNNAGDVTVQSTYGTTGNAALTFASIAARNTSALSKGYTANFVVSGGTNGTTNKIVITGQGAGFINQGAFFGGTDYAYMNSTGGYVRAPVYGTDSGFVNVGGVTALSASNHNRVTASRTGQAAVSVNTLKFDGASIINLALTGNLTLLNNGIIRSGGNATTISGSNIVLTTGSTAGDFVIHTASANDSLTITSGLTFVASSNTGITKSGAGKLTLPGVGLSGSALGGLWVNAGTLSFGGNFTTFGGQGLTVFHGAVVDLNNTTSNNSNGGYIQGPNGTNAGVITNEAGNIVTLNVNQFGGNAGVNSLAVELKGNLNFGVYGNRTNIFINAANTYKGATTFSGLDGQVAVDTVYSRINGITSALPANTSLVFSDGNIAKTGVKFVYKLNSFDQSLASVSNVHETATQPVAFEVGNYGAADATLTLNGRCYDASTGILAANRALVTSPNKAFSGNIVDGSTGRLSLVLDAPASFSQTLSGLNAYTGSTRIKGGTLKLSGAYASNISTSAQIIVGSTAAESAAKLDVTALTDGAIVLDPAQTLSGHGTVVGDVRTSTNGTTGSLISPGNSVGILSIDGDLTMTPSVTSTLEIEIGNATLGAGVGFDQLVATGAVAIKGARLNIIPISGAVAGMTYKIVHAPDLDGGGADLGYESDDPEDNFFAKLNDQAATHSYTAGGGFKYNLSYQSGDGIYLTLVAIPEPAAMSLLLGCGLLVRRARRSAIECALD